MFIDCISPFMKLCAWFFVFFLRLNLWLVCLSPLDLQEFIFLDRASFSWLYLVETLISSTPLWLAVLLVQ